jgi:hypothetical protein
MTDVGITLIFFKLLLIGILAKIFVLALKFIRKPPEE